ncbi:MAG: tetratricopeptide repeat protein [Gammaproteobacteria bacterium]|nr:tetratricopeptide repeat protein [Gammaproteobacteria bacterium]
MRGFAGVLLCGTVSVLSPAIARDDERLQELLYGEALFLSHQQDYLSAISRLQMAEEQGLLSSSSEDARLLLARMKLAYGLHVEAGFDFHALLGKDVPEPVRNRAWYELARTFSRKGYNEAAAEALEHVQGDVPADIAGDYQLLHATVLMALNRNLEAAQVLEPWQGAPELAAYDYYNRGIALVRAGDHQQAVTALAKAVDMPAKGEELLALRDKAYLSLGYAYARAEDYKRAQKQLEAVRPQGPFSNRALLALGWIAHKQGRSESALVPWMELRGRSPTDPAVLETLLVVPAVYRELDALQTATRDYEAAMAAYTSELKRLQDARDSVQTGDTVSLLLQNERAAGQGAAGQTASGKTVYFGPLLASRDFQEMLQGHDDLQIMLQKIDRGLGDIDVLEKAAIPMVDAGKRNGDSLSSPPAGRIPAGKNNGYHASQQQGQGRSWQTGEPQWQQQWDERQGEPADLPAPGIPQLPEIELPADRQLEPLPESDFTGLPDSDFSGLPPESEYIKDLSGAEDNWLPDSEIVWLPETGRFQMPKGEEDYAYPDKVPQQRTRPGDQFATRLSRLIPAPEDEPGFNAGAVPVGEALRELAAALNSATERMAQLGESFDTVEGVAGLDERIAALRARILRLRTRIASAIALYEAYTQALALDELDRRQHLLEDLLEQASLELAKTYDQTSDR